MFVRSAASVIAAFILALLFISSAGTDEVTALDATKLVAPAVMDHSSETEPFGLATTIVSDGPIVTMWDIMETSIRADREVLIRCHEAGERCPVAAQSFLAIVAEGREHTGRARIGVVNRAINLTIQAASENRWTAPLETFAMGRGNCKQYAIAKYVALIEAGINEDDVKLVIVHDLATGDNHAVVAVHLDSGWILLDNRWLNMVPDTEMRGVIPLFVLDRHGAKQFLPMPHGSLS